jgi:DNA-binding MarR family transcriptional regulator
MAVLARVERLAQLVQNDLAPLFASHGITAGDFDVLAALRRAPRGHSLSPRALSHALLVTSGGMTNRLNRLEGAGLVERIANPDDGGSILVELTPAGLELVEQVVRRHVEREQVLLATLDGSRRRELARLLGEVLGALEAATATGPRPFVP